MREKRGRELSQPFLARLLQAKSGAQEKVERNDRQRGTRQHEDEQAVGKRLAAHRNVRQSQRCAQDMGIHVLPFLEERFRSRGMLVRN